LPDITADPNVLAGFIPDPSIGAYNVYTTPLNSGGKIQFRLKNAAAYRPKKSSKLYRVRPYLPVRRRQLEGEFIKFINSVYKHLLGLNFNKSIVKVGLRVLD